MKYAFFDPETGELKIGMEVPGLVSHGQAMSKGFFSDESTARSYASEHDVTSENFYIG